MSNENFNIADYLDKPIDAMPDMPQRGFCPAGKHVVRVKDAQMKELGGKKALVFQYTYLGCEELVDPAARQVKENEDIEEVFFIETETGLGALKEHLKTVAGSGTTLSAALQGIIDQQFRIVTTVREWKDKKTGEMRKGWGTKGGLQPLAA